YAVLTVLCRHRLPSSRQNDLQDFVQETMLSLLHSLGSSEERFIRDPVPYALRIAANKCNNALRETYHTEEVSVEAKDGVAVLSDLVQTAAEHSMMEAQFNERLLSALERLDSEEREFLRLRYFDEMDNAAASKRLGVAPDEGSRLKW